MVLSYVIVKGFAIYSFMGYVIEVCSFAQSHRNLICEISLCSRTNRHILHLTIYTILFHNIIVHKNYSEKGSHDRPPFIDISYIYSFIFTLHISSTIAISYIESKAAINV